MEFMESELESWAEDSTQDFCSQGTMKFLCRQFVLPSGRRIDMLAVERPDEAERIGRLVVFEFKRGVVDESAVCQILAYLAELRELVRAATPGNAPPGTWDLSGIRGILVGQSISTWADLALAALPQVEFCRIEPAFSVAPPFAWDQLAYHFARDEAAAHTGKMLEYVADQFLCWDEADTNRAGAPTAGPSD